MIRFDVLAGRYDDGDRNCKYCDSFNTFEEALSAWEGCRGYSWSQILAYRGSICYDITPTVPINKRG